MYFRWSGWGILALPMLIASVLGGAAGALKLFHDQIYHGTDQIDRGGIILGGIAVGVILGSGLLYLLGNALNGQKQPDGSTVWTDRHTVFDLPLEEVGWLFGAVGVALFPLTTIGFLPAVAIWILFLSWAVATIVIGLKLFHAWESSR